MTQTQIDLINRLAQIEEQLVVLWDYHPDNKDKVDVEERFNKLQKEASSIEDFLQKELS